MAKMMLATRNPVFGEFMRRFLWDRSGLSAKYERCSGRRVACRMTIAAADTGCLYRDTRLNSPYTCLLRKDAACTRMPMTARPINTIVDPDGGNTIAL